MALITFPVSKAAFADLLKIESVDWNLRRSELVSNYGNGELLTSEIAPPRWEASVRTVRMLHKEARKVQAMLNAVGSMETFLLYDPRSKYPYADPDGTIFGASTPVVASINADNKRIGLQGFPAGYVITQGDMIEIIYDSGDRYFLCQAMENETADGSGDLAQFEVRPHLIETIATSDPVTVIKPAAKMKLVPGSDRFESVSPATSVITFQAIQTHQDT